MRIRSVHLSALFTINICLLTSSTAAAFDHKPIKVNEFNSIWGHRELENAIELYNAGQFEEARSLAKDALVYAENNRFTHQVVRALQLLGEIEIVTENYATAESYLERALAISEKNPKSSLFPEEYADVTKCLNLLGSLHAFKGSFAKAESFQLRAIEIGTKDLGPDNPEVAESFFYLGSLYLMYDKYAKAEPALQRALEITEKSRGPDHSDVAELLQLLAQLHIEMNSYAKAEPLLDQVMSIREKVLGQDHPQFAKTLDTLASLYRGMGDYATAESLYSRALRIMEKARKPDHPDIANALNSLGALYLETGAYNKAEPMLQRALRIAEKKDFAFRNIFVAQILGNLGTLYSKINAYPKAKPFLRRSVKILEQSSPISPVLVKLSTVLSYLGTIERKAGNHPRAQSLHQRALDIKKKILGPQHFDIAGILGNLADVEAAEQRYLPALELYKKALTIENLHIRSAFPIMSEQQKLMFIRSLPGTYRLSLSLIHQYLAAEETAVRDGLAIVLQRKGIVFDAESRKRESLHNHLSGTAREQWSILSSLRSDLARLLLHKPEKMLAQVYTEKLASLQQQIEKAEKHLAKDSTLVATEFGQRAVTVEAVAGHLPPHTALVEFVKIQDFDFSGGRWLPSFRYLAFILTAENDVKLVDLGEAEALEKSVRHALGNIRISIESRAPLPLQETTTASTLHHTASLNNLYHLLWAPIEQLLGDIEQIIVSPDGMVNLVPFSSLMDDQERFLIERYQHTYVTSGRDMVRAKQPPSQSRHSLLLLANPAFDSRNARSTASDISNPSLRSRELSGTFSPLPGTVQESQQIPSLITGNGSQQVLVGIQATESAVKTALSPRIVHLATHGFFLRDEELALGDLNGRLRALDTGEKRQPKAKESSTNYENPLVRSGLAFAGANYASKVTEGDDGILTALEISGMDLYGTEMVVLSACDTGVGEIKAGEGVFGLRRAFALAGAKHLLMSLWPVSDEITALQMKTFYKNLQTMAPTEALRQAQLDTIKQLKARYDGQAPPGLWAPFILQGAQPFGP